MTPKRKQVLDAIKRHMDQHGTSPTYQEIGDALGLTIWTVREHVIRLVASGHLRQTRWGKRSIRLPVAFDVEVHRLVRQHGVQRLKAAVAEIESLAAYERSVTL